MSTKAEAEKAESAKKGLNAKSARKNGQRKPRSTTSDAAEPNMKKREQARGKRDSQLVRAAEQVASSPEERARRAKIKKTRVRTSGRK